MLVKSLKCRYCGKVWRLVREGWSWVKGGKDEYCFCCIDLSGEGIIKLDSVKDVMYYDIWEV